MTPAAPTTTASEPPKAEPAASHGAAQQSAAVPTDPAPPALATTGPVITLEQFKSLETEMPYGRVVEIFGWKGVKSDREDFGGVVLEKVEWMNPDGSKVNAIFRDDKLYSREQTGLKTAEQLAAGASSTASPTEEKSADPNENGGAAPQ